MKVLITGAHGFVGRHVQDELSDWDIVAPHRSELNCMSTYDMMEALRREKPDAVVHLAATCGGIGINKDNPGKFIYENLVMGISVLEACRNFRYVNNQIHNPLAKKDTPRVVFLGTVCQYPKFTPVPFKEEELWNGYPEETNAPYGIAKRAVMEMGIAYNKQYELEVVNFLPVNMAGEYDNFNLYSSHVIPALIRKFEEAGKHEPVELWGTGSASREFLYAGDTAKAIRKAIEGPYVGPEPMNLGTGREITIKDLAERIKEVGGYSSSILWDDTKPDGQPRRCLDTTQATERLGWTAETDIDEMLSRTIHWYRENKDA